MSWKGSRRVGPGRAAAAGPPMQSQFWSTGGPAPLRACPTLLFPAVELIVRDQQIGKNAAVDDGLFNDPRHVRELHAAVPDGLWIDDDGRPQLALIQAAGRVGPHLGFEIAPLKLLLKGAFEFLVAIGIA